MSRYAFMADLHARGKDLSAFRAQMEEVVQWFDQNQDCDTLVIVGDVFHSAAVGDNYASTGAVAQAVKEPLQALLVQGVDIYVLVGNHDQSGIGSADALHVIEGMRGYPGELRVIRSPEIIEVADDNVDLIAIPWSWDGKNNNPSDQAMALADEALRRVNEPGHKIVLAAHVQVVGAKMSQTFTCERKAHAWQMGRAVLDSLPVDHIALGDFHRRQELVPGKGGYVGALRHLTHADQGNPAGFEVWDSQTGETECVELDAAPRYWTIDVKADGTEIRPEGIREGFDKVRLRYEAGAVSEADAREAEAKGYQVEEIFEPEERVRRAEVPEGVVDDTRGLLDLWINTQPDGLFPEPRRQAAHQALDRLLGKAQHETQQTEVVA